MGIGFEEYAATRGAALLRLATALTGSPADAQDVVQDALSRALPRWDRICTVDDPDAYVRRMVVNAHVSWWRRFRRREAPVADVRTSGGDRLVPDAADEALRRDEDSALWDACAGLVRDQRVAVVLRFYEQLSYAEIAALTGVAEATARSRVHRGLAQLRAVMSTDQPAYAGSRTEGEQDA